MQIKGFIQSKKPPGMEYMFTLIQKEMTCPTKPWKTYKGSYQGEWLGPVLLSEATWLMPQKEKDALWAKHKVRVGGPCPIDDTKARTKAKTNLCFVWPKTLYDNLIDVINVIGVCNLTGNDGALETECIESSIPCLTVCLTTRHKEHLKVKIVKGGHAMMINE